MIQREVTQIPVEQAGFVFAGTVRRVAAATIAGVVADRTAVVHVDSAIYWPALLQAYVGRDVTVELLAPEAHDVDRQALFFAHGWIYGRGLGLREIAHRPVNDDLTRVRQEVVEARQRLAGADLKRRLVTAEVVVAGRVAHTAAVVSRDTSRPIREHDPQWTEAVVLVDRVLRGRGVADSLVVVFPASRDVAWRRAAKLTVGQEGVWLLRTHRIEETDRTELVLVDPGDSHAPEQVHRIAKLLDEIG